MVLQPEQVTLITTAFYAVYGTGLVWMVVMAIRRTLLSRTAYLQKSFIQMLIFYSLYAFWLLIPFSLWLSLTGQMGWAVSGPVLLLSLLIVYARFIEPNRLVVRHHHIQLEGPRPLSRPLRVAVLGDLHIGLFSGQPRQLRRIVRAVTAQQPDFVVVAGDWTYEPGDDLAGKLRPLAALNVPVYSVPGNHDEEEPGPPIQQALRDALDLNGIQPIEDCWLDLDDVLLAGTGDLWAGKAQLGYLRQLPLTKPVLVLCHNPDTVDMVPEGLPYRPLMICGHTHGGQVFLPWATQWVLHKESKYGFRRDLYQFDRAQIFVTAGTGMVAAPFRFRVPPCVDILELR